MWYMQFVGRNKFIDYIFRTMVSKSIETKLNKKIGGGQRPEIYVICRPHPAGFFSDYFYVLGHIIIADRMGMIPYIDMQNYPSLYSEKEPVNGIMNSWEYYFNSFNNQTIEKAYSSSHIICEEKYPYQLVPYYSTTNLLNEGYPTKTLVRKLNKYIEKYVTLNEEIQKSFENEIIELGIEECVGVHIRGTDMKHTKGHIVPIGIKKAIEKLEHLQVRYDIKKFFLCTDEEDVKNRVLDTFRGKVEVVFLDAYRSINNEEGLHLETQPHTERSNHKYHLGLEVLKDAYFLSKCKGLVCGKSNVAYAAIVFNNNQYEWIDCE